MPTSMDLFAAPTLPPQAVALWLQGSANLYAAVVPESLACNSLAFTAGQRQAVVAGTPATRLNICRVLFWADAPTLVVMFPTGRTGQYIEGYCSTTVPLAFDYGLAGLNKGNTGDGIDVYSSAATTVHYNILYHTQPWDLA